MVFSTGLLRNCIHSTYIFLPKSFRERKEINVKKHTPFLANNWKPVQTKYRLAEYCTMYIHLGNYVNNLTEIHHSIPMY